MILTFVILIAIAATLLAVVTFVQMLYLESLRLRTRETEAMEFFKDVLEEKLGVKNETGVLTFSLIKHTLLVFVAVVFWLVALGHEAPVWQTFIETLLLGWVTMLAATYVVPPTLMRRTSGRWVLPFVPILRALAVLIRPLTLSLLFFQSLAQLGREEETPHENGEHIEALITAGTEEGIIEEEDRKLIQSVVAFGDKTVREVMTPRPNIVAFPNDRPLADLRQLVINEQYSRIPIYEGAIDNIIGFVHVRDLFELDPQQRADSSIMELIRPIRFVPETKPVDDLLREMQQDGAHMAIVVDEYGNTAGLATMEDLVEEIFGEIRDEHEPTRDVTAEPNGSYVVSGSFDLDHLHDLLEFRPEAETESTTVGGLVTEWLGRVPRPGEEIERDGIRIEVLAGNELRVEQVRISRAAVEEKTFDGQP